MKVHREQWAHPEGGTWSVLRVSAAEKSAASDTVHRPLLVFSHATGFNADTYLPLFSALVGHMDILAIDSRGHGHSQLPCGPAQLKSWERYYRDLEQLVCALNQPCFLAGHSIGGTCSIAVARRQPSLVKGVIALDPVFLDPTQGWSMRVLQWLGRSDRFSLAAGAKRRKATFGSTAEAYDNYRQKKSFASWPDHWLKAYVDSAFAPDAQGVRLRCDPLWESRTFSMVEPAPWRHLKRNPVAALFLLAAHHSTCGPRSQRILRRHQPDWDLRTVPESSHFLPMEKTADVASAIVSFVDMAQEKRMKTLSPIDA